jgi:hypothetical protein
MKTPVPFAAEIGPDSKLVFGGRGARLRLDEVRIVNRALGPAEIRSLVTANEPHRAEDDCLLLDHLEGAACPGGVERVDGATRGLAYTRPEKSGSSAGTIAEVGARYCRGKYGTGLELGPYASVLDALYSAGVRTVCFHEHWSRTQSDADVAYPEKFRALIRACHERGMKLLPYFGFQISELNPWWPMLREECRAEPRSNYYFMQHLPYQEVEKVCYRSVWSDYLIFRINGMLRDYDIDGVYLDTTASPRICRNPLHGCGYDNAQGTGFRASFPIFAVRSMVERIAAVVHSYKADGLVDIHQSTCMVMPTLAWASSFWNGENFAMAVYGRQSPLEIIDLDKLRIEYLADPWGIQSEFISFDHPFRYREVTALLLLLDVLVRCFGPGPHLDLESRIWQIFKDFDRGHARRLGYWENQQLVRTSPAGIYTGIYCHPEQRALLVVSNLNAAGTECRIEIDPRALGLPDSANIRDVLNDRDLGRGRECTVSLDGMDFTIIEYRP